MMKKIISLRPSIFLTIFYPLVIILLMCILINTNLSYKLSIILFLCASLIIFLVIQILRLTLIDIKMIFREKTLKNKKMVIVKNIKKHGVSFRYVNRLSSALSYFTGFIINPKDNKKYEIKTDVYYVGLFCKEPKIIFAYVDENDYSKYYIDLKQTNEYMHKQNFSYIKDIFKKYDAFSKEKSVSKDIIEKECELDLKYLLKQNIIMEKEDKYYYSLVQEDKVIKLNYEKLRKEKRKDIMQILITIIISLVIGDIILYIISRLS